MEGSNQGARQACFSDAVLSSYFLGQLADADAENVRIHVAACPECSLALEAVQNSSSDEHLLEKIQQAFTSEVPVGPRFVRALDQLANPLNASSTDDGSDPSTVAETEKLPQGGRYELLERIGNGAMGVVYRAKQQPIDRIVALKMIIAGIHATPKQVSRFLTEGKAVARLHHLNIVHVYDFGELEGRPFLAMEYVGGETLAAVLGRGPLAPAAAASLLRTLAEAMAYAHEQRVIHRDLKPSNILLAPDGTPKITDFGLAKLADSDANQTYSDAIIGTPAYMAPEIAWGNATKADERSDVYSLGAVLYHALTGSPPFEGETRVAILQSVRATEPPSPRTRNSKVPEALNVICRKCLEKKAERRYQNAGLLAQDLRSWEATKTLQVARVPTAIDRFATFVYRRIRVFSLLCAVILAIIIMPVAFFYSDPDRALIQIENELIQGKPVTLIGETGAPKWFRVKYGADETKTSLGERGNFTVQSFAPICLIELITECRPKTYRIEAEVSHVTGLRPSEVGIFLAYSHLEKTRSTPGRFLQISFDEMPDDKDIAKAIALLPALPRDAKTPRSFGLYCHLLKNPISSGSTRIKLKTGPLHAPAGEASGCWRKITADVTRDGIEVAIDGKPFPHAQTHEIDSLFSQFNTRMLPALGGAANEKNIQQINMTGGLGLLVVRGSAEFKNVFIKPK